MNLICGKLVYELLSHYSVSTLQELFGVPGLALHIDHALDGLDIEAPAGAPHFLASTQPAIGTKCERCWRYVPDVGDQEKYPTVCLRCAEALAAIHFQPYTAESEKGAAQ